MPAPEIPLVVFVLGDDENFWRAGHRLNEFVHVQHAKAASQPKVLLGRQTLITEKDDAMVEQRLVHIGGGCIVEVFRQIDPSTTAPRAPLIGRTLID